MTAPATLAPLVWPYRDHRTVAELDARAGRPCGHCRAVFGSRAAAACVRPGCNWRQA